MKQTAKSDEGKQVKTQMEESISQVNQRWNTGEYINRTRCKKNLKVA